ncbi:Ig-like domain-containing protein (plasmid) [Pseudomonas viciae]|uniref:Ig-like domain-containing protein n=1 Tax=Pseudomonas viciae TaxID=2505979 RepID=A0ABY8PMJ1_9PSED|nr:Ig-like domain-containing protein [Pseudomonas viciae]WGO96456.1 Ig-like domain-containing protein [Pseudomonas viciae]
MATGALNAAATTEVKEWFSARHATAELSLTAGGGGARSGSFDLLLPIFDTDADLVFTQLGIRRSNARTESYRNTINLGAGWRHTLDKWLFGANAFYDRDTTGRNDRIGVGAEAWTDFLKLSANSYFRLSDWKVSPDLDDYLERPANGWDVRAEAYLPAYPQLGGKFVYEQYYGDDVGLFSATDRQKNPSAVTVGLNYAPVPALVFGADYRQGQGGLSETSLKMGINYQFGVPLAKQWSPDQVKASKLLANARYDLVNRNNEIVLDYRKAEHALLMLPPEISGTPTATVSFPVTLTGGRASNFTWTGTASSFARPYNSSGVGTVVLPAYSPSGLNTYSLQAVGTDVYGEVVKSNVMQVTVTPFLIALASSKAEAKADGSDEVVFTASLQEPSGSPRANTAITWAVSGPATVVEKDSMTNKQGRANLKLVSRASSVVRVSAKEPQGAAASADAGFIGDPTSAKIVGLVATPAAILADGKATSTLVATVIDKNGNELGAGVPVTWASTAGALASTSTVTDETSKATVVLTSPVQIGDATVTAQAVAGSADARVDFVADTANARVLSLVASPGVIPADETTTSLLTATIVDANGNPVGAGVPVTWSTTDGTLSTAASVTDASSKTVVALKSSTKMGTATVTAKAAAGEQTATVAFTANSATAKVIDLTATPTSIVADGTTTSNLVATVEDANGNPVANAPVTWTTSTGTLSAASSTTDANGKTSVTLKGTAAGSATVKAQASAGASTANVTLTSDGSTAKVIDLTATPTSIVADGTTTSNLVATVEDANGNPVANAPVTWTTSTGTLSAASSTTDANGKTSVTLKGTAAGSATVKAQASAGASTANVTLTSDGSTAKVIDLTATPTSIVADGTTTSNLVATVEDANGNPVANAPVTWTTSTGTLSAASSTTDANGKTSVTLKGTAAGSATVKAQASAGASTANVTLTSDGSTAKVIDLTATPTSIVADGTTTSNLVATVEDANGNPVANAPVTWTTSTGTLSAASSTTDANGKTSVTLKGTAAGSATVKAQASAGASTANVTLTADVSTARVITVVATPGSTQANIEDGVELVATVVDAFGNAVPAGVSVRWTTNGGDLAFTRTVTDATGKATNHFGGSFAGTYIITAGTIGGAANTSVTVTGNLSQAHVVSLTANPTTIIANGTSTSLLAAVVEDDNGNPVANAPVTWTTSTGTLSAASSTTDANGKTSVTLKGTAAGTATVKAQASAGASTANVTLTSDGSTAKVIDLTATPTSIVANGTATSNLVATVEDANGNPVVNAPVTWTTSTGTLSAASSTTDANGKTSVTLKGTAVGTATVKAQAVAGADTVNVTLAGDSSTAKVIDLTATPTSIVADGTTTSNLVATVEDANGNPVANAPVTWTTSTGTLSAVSSTTDASGKTSVTLKGTTAAIASVKAQAVAGASTASVTLTADSSTANIVLLTASPAAITANGVTASTLSARVQDANNNVLAGVTVNWSTDLGALSSATSVTNGSGYALVTLKGTVAGAANVKASVIAGNSTVVVNLVADASTAQVTSLVATPTSIVANGTATSTLVATVKDANGNTLGSGVAVSWSTSLGNLSTASSVTNASGQAAVTLSGAVAGSATVTASAVAGSASATVTLTQNAPTITAINATDSTTYLNYDSTAPRLAWAGTGLSGSTTYLVTVVDANSNYQQYYTGPSSFTPAAGVNSWWLNRTRQQKNGYPEDLPSPYSGKGVITLKACNGTACSTATTTFNWSYDYTGSN